MTSTRKALVAGGVAVAIGALALAGTSWAGRSFGPHGGMAMMHPMVGEMLAGVDADKSGSLSQQEISGAVNARFSSADGNTDNQLSLDEFQVMWAEVTRPIAVRAFQFLDPNGDAAVAKDELDARFGALVQRFDKNGDGALSPEDRRGFGRGGREREE